MANDPELHFLIESDAGQITVRGPSGRTHRHAPLWSVDRDFQLSCLRFQSLAAEPIQGQRAHDELTRHAARLGRSLLNLLTDDAGIPLDPGPAGVGRRVILASDDDMVLSLPWELLFHDGSFLVRDGRIDLRRTTPGGEVRQLKEPGTTLRLLVNVAAPEGSELNHEVESHRISRALAGRSEVAHTELGSLEDLTALVKAFEPTAIHFSGHGTPGTLELENSEGLAEPVAIGDLVHHLKKAARKLPAFFYLACCHGNELPVLGDSQAGSLGSAATLHREGIDDVVAYFGPISDELATLAEEALYEGLSRGEPTGRAVHRARAALSRHVSGPGAGHPFAWAQIVFYHRGPETIFAVERSSDTSAGREILNAGFVGRRRELHEIRRRVREGGRVVVLQGMGGVGKSTLAQRALAGLSDRNVCSLWCQEVERDSEPVRALMDQFLTSCRQHLGPAWEEVVEAIDRDALREPLDRFSLLVSAAFERIPRLAIHLDHIDSLLASVSETTPGAGAAAVGGWRVPDAKRLWDILFRAATQQGSLCLMASSRYRNSDFAGALLPVGRLDQGAVFRLTSWCPALARLSVAARQRLSEHLGGHPLGVVIADELSGPVLESWEERHGAWISPDASEPAALDREWDELVAATLPRVDDRLRQALRLEELWRALDEASRAMLYRATLLREPWEWGVAGSLGEPGESEAAARSRAGDLLRASWLEPIPALDAGVSLRYAVTPVVSRFVVEKTSIVDGSDRATHLRLASYFEGAMLENARAGHNVEEKLQLAAASAIACGYHYCQARELNRATGFLVNGANALHQRRRYQEALDLVSPLLDQQTLWPEHRASLLIAAGQALSSLGQPAAAIRHFETARALIGKARNPASQVAVLSNLAMVSMAQFETEMAIEPLDRCLQLCREHDLPQVAVLSAVCQLFFNAGHFEEAEKYAGLLKAAADRDGDPHGGASAIGFLANLHVVMEEWGKAEEKFRELLSIHQGAGDPHFVAVTLGNLANMFARSGNHVAAIEEADKALTAFRDLEDPLGQAQSWLILGRSYHALGDTGKAVECFAEVRCLAPSPLLAELGWQQEQALKAAAGRSDSRNKTEIEPEAVGDPELEVADREARSVARQLTEKLSAAQERGRWVEVDFRLAELRRLARRYRVDPAIDSALARGLAITLGDASGAEAMERLAELRELARAHDDPRMLNLLAASLTNVSGQVAEDGGDLDGLLNELGALQRELPADDEVRQWYAGALVNSLDPRLDIHAERRDERLDRLRQLTRSFPEDRSLPVELAAGLVSSAAAPLLSKDRRSTQPLIDELRLLVEQHPDDGEILTSYATAQLNRHHAEKPGDLRGRVALIDELHAMAESGSVGADVYQMLADQLMDTVQRSDPEGDQELGIEIHRRSRRLWQRFPHDPVVRERFGMVLLLLLQSAHRHGLPQRRDELFEELGRLFEATPASDGAIASLYVAAMKVYLAETDEQGDSNDLARLDSVLDRLRRVSQKHPDQEDVRELLAMLISNAVGSHSRGGSDARAAQLLNELRDLARQYPDPSVVEPLANAIVNRIVGRRGGGDLPPGLLSELEALAARYGDSATVNTALGLVLYNRMLETTDPEEGDTLLRRIASHAPWILSKMLPNLDPVRMTYWLERAEQLGLIADEWSD